MEKTCQPNVYIFALSSGKIMEKYILGVSGWPERSHDAAAALIHCDASGKVTILGAIEEERFTRKKHAFDTFPVLSVRYLLEQAGITPSDLTAVVLGWDYPLLYRLRKIPLVMDEGALLSKLFPGHTGKMPPLRYSNHHRNHASSAFRASGFKEATVIVIDGQGEEDSTSVWHGKDNKLSKILSIGIGSSLGYMYENLTVYAGFDSFNAGKTMGLAPYGDRDRYFSKLMEYIVLDEDGFYVKPLKDINGSTPGKGDEPTFEPYDEIKEIWFSIFKQVTGLEPYEGKIGSFTKMPKDHVDLSASVQKVLEEIVKHIAKIAIAKTGSKDICMAGGVALNCVANGKLVEEGLVEEIFVQPAANDAGNCIGAALEYAADLGFDTIADGIMSPYLGPEYTDSEICKVLDANGISYTLKDDLSEDIARLISEGNVVAVFQGRMEIGPRALGSRSFLADPRNLKMWEYINEEIKHREHGRPLAPSLLMDKASDYLKDARSSPFMNLAFQVKCPERIPAVTHVDNSTRPQTVTKEMNPVYYSQIKAFGDLTGVYMLLNTSLNDTEPIVCSPDDAVNLLKRSKVDHMAFNNRILVKNQKSR